MSSQNQRKALESVVYKLDKPKPDLVQRKWVGFNGALVFVKSPAGHGVLHQLTKTERIFTGNEVVNERKV